MIDRILELLADSGLHIEGSCVENYGFLGHVCLSDFGGKDITQKVRIVIQEGEVVSVAVILFFNLFLEVDLDGSEIKKITEKLEKNQENLEFFEEEKRWMAMGFVPKGSFGHIASVMTTDIDTYNFMWSNDFRKKSLKFLELLRKYWPLPV